jgi:hypothetical protein
VRKLVASLKDIAAVLVCEELGISVTYDPTRRVAKLDSRPQTPWARVSVGGAYDPVSTPAMLKGRVRLKAA